MRVLIVEDEVQSAETLAQALVKIDENYAVKHVTSVAAAVAELETGRAYDFALVDLGLPDASDFEAPAKLCKQFPEVGVLALTGSTDTALAAAIMRLGAQDFLYKGHCGPLVVDRALRLSMERKERELALKEPANLDSLTGVLNRRGSLALLEGKASSYLIGRDVGLALVYVGLNGFEAINDEHGHAVGDAVLQACAQRIDHCLRANDRVARIVDDEFAIIFDVEDPLAETTFVAQKVIEKLAQPFAIGDIRMTLSASVGIACMPEHAESVSELVDCARNAMFEAKDLGQGQCVYSVGYAARESTGS